jgi:hypothetical protein
VLLPYPERWALKVTWSLVILSTQVQYGLAAMGEDTAEVWSKAAMDPNSPSESDIARIQFLIDFWWNLHNRMAYLDEEGLADDKWRDAFRYLTAYIRERQGRRIDLVRLDAAMSVLGTVEHIRTPTCSEMLRASGS